MKMMPMQEDLSQDELAVLARALGVSVAAETLLVGGKDG